MHSIKRFRHLKLSFKDPIMLKKRIYNVSKNSNVFKNKVKPRTSCHGGQKKNSFNYE